MKKTMKKILCSLLVVVMCSTCAPLQGFADLDWNWIDFNVRAVAEEYTEGYYTYKIENGKATIVDVSTAISGDVTIPSTLGGYSVETIGDEAFRSCYNIKSITIPDSITSIGDHAFSGCKKLTSITIPDSVTSIGFRAFEGCRQVTIHAPAGSFAKTYAKENNIPFVAE